MAEFTMQSAEQRAVGGGGGLKAPSLRACPFATQACSTSRRSAAEAPPGYSRSQANAWARDLASRDLEARLQSRQRT